MNKKMLSETEVKQYALEANKWVPSIKNQLIGGDTSRFLMVSRNDGEWHKALSKVLGIDIHENHVQDSLNNEHPPKYENTTNYDVLILPTLIHFEPGSSSFSQCTIFVSNRFILLVHPPNWPLEGTVYERIVREKPKNPNTIPGLLSFIVNSLVNAQLGTRLLYTTHMESWQEKMIGKDRHSGDWSSFFDMQKELNRFIDQTEMQWESLSEWRAETELDFTNHERVRFADALEHLQRLSNHLKSVRTDSDNLLQIYFSMTQEKTNDIMRLLTVISVILLPLNLITGIFGMNFNSIPLISKPSGFWVAIGLMTIVSSITVIILKRLRWL